MRALGSRFNGVMSALSAFGCVYGPVSYRFETSSGRLYFGQNWKPDVRMPLWRTRVAWRAKGISGFAQFPIAATCSPLAAVLGWVAVEAGDQWSHEWGKSITSMMDDSPVFRPRREWMSKPGKYNFRWSDLADPAFEMRTPLAFVMTSGHVVTMLDGEALGLLHPTTGQPINERFVIAADGGMKTEWEMRNGKRRAKRRWFNGKPTVMHTARERAKTRPDQLVRVAFVEPKLGGSFDPGIVWDVPGRGRTIMESMHGLHFPRRVAA